MGIIKAFSGALGGTFADQWKDIVTVKPFDEHIVVLPGYLKTMNKGRGSNTKSSEGILSNGTKIYVPENTAAFIFSESGIENIITEAGGYEYQNGEYSIFNKDGIKKSIFEQVKDRVAFGGIPDKNKEIAFVNLREIRNLKFGTRGPQVYNDLFYGVDLEIIAYGSFTIKVTDPEKFIKKFVPANVKYYSFDNEKVKAQLTSEFLQSFIAALNSLSNTFRISQLPSQASVLSQNIANDQFNAGTWPDRFGFSIVQVSVENIKFTEDSHELVKQYSANKMSLKAYEDVSQRASDIAAQQKIAQGIQDNGLGDGGGMVFGMNIAQGLSTQNAQNSVLSFEQQLENLKKLKELLDAGILTEQEFEIKKKEIMGL